MEQQRATSSRGRGRNAAIARSSFADFRRSPDAGQFVLALQLMARMLRRRPYQAAEGGAVESLAGWATHPAAICMVSREEAEAWRTHGYFTRDLPAAVVDAARAAAHFSKPSDSGHTDFGSNGAYEFPCGEDGLDLLPLELHDCAAELLGGPVVLSQADCWVKHAAAIVPSGKMSNQSQRMHADWGNNQIMPPVWSEPSAVAALVYLDGPEDGLEGGGTSVAPRSGDDDAAYALERLIEQPGYGGRPFLNDSEEAEAWFRANEPEVAERRAQLYAREQYLAPARGRALVYRLDLWHHGTPVLAGQRRAYNIVYHSQQQHPAALSGGRWEKGFWRMAYDVKNGFYGAQQQRPLA